MSSTKPNALFRSRPWFAEKQLRKTPEARYKREVNRRIFGLVAPIVFLPLAFATGASPILVIPGIGIGLVQSVYHLWGLKKHPEHFQQKDAATRALLADFRTRMASGTWTGPKYRPTWMYTTPLAAAFIGLQFPALLHTSVVIGVVVAVLALVALGGLNVARMRKQIEEMRTAMAARAA